MRIKRAHSVPGRWGNLTPLCLTCVHLRKLALSSATFASSPLDRSLALPEAYDWYLESTLNSQLVIFTKQNEPEARKIL